MNFTFRFLNRLAQKVRAGWKYLLSFRKREWEFDDYPIRLEYRPPNADTGIKLGPQWKSYPYSAGLINWSISGSGDTEEEALQKLRQIFEKEKAKGNRPRPGSVVPIKLASQTRILPHQELADDLLMRIFEIEEAWVSDESSLWNFNFGYSIEEPLRRIGEIYGVDVSDIESGNMAEILERIASARDIQARL